MQKTEIKLDAPLGKILAAIILLVLMPFLLFIILVVVLIAALLVIISPIIALVSPINVTFEGNRIPNLKDVLSVFSKSGARVIKTPPKKK